MSSEEWGLNPIGLVSLGEAAETAGVHILREKAM